MKKNQIFFKFMILPTMLASAETFHLAGTTGIRSLSRVSQRILSKFDGPNAAPAIFLTNDSIPAVSFALRVPNLVKFDDPFSVGSFRVDPETFETEFYNYTLVTVHPTDLRMNDAYIFWYNNLAKLLITGLIPFLSLCIFNTRIYGALRRRRNVMGPNATAAHQQQLNEDNRQALVLFSIVIIFLISNVPRIALNLHEVRDSTWRKPCLIVMERKDSILLVPLWSLTRSSKSRREIGFQIRFSLPVNFILRMMLKSHVKSKDSMSIVWHCLITFPKN